MNSVEAPPLFYHPGLGHPGAATITGAEANHICRSRRLGAGDAVHLTDGNGTLARCRVAAVTPRPLALEVCVESLETTPPPAVEVTLAAAIPKGERQAVMLDMATQLGMTRFIPLHCERGAVRCHAGMRRRWERIIISACKQCRQCHFPVIDAQTDVASVLRAWGDAPVVAGERNGLSLSRMDTGIIRSVQTIDAQPITTPKIMLLVGPEGGFSRAERALLTRRGVLCVSLGAHVLRTETAAVALLAALHQRLDPSPEQS